MIPRFRNPGPWSFGIFAVAAALVAFLNYRGVPDSVKLAGQLVTLAVATFAAKSALTKREPTGTTLPPPHPRARFETWGGFDEGSKPKSDDKSGGAS